MRTTATTARLVGGLTLALLLLAACGSGGDSGSAGSGSNATVSTGQACSNTVLIDSTGRTLYFTDQDSGGTIACGHACARIWTALTVPVGTTPTAAPDVPGRLGTMTRPDGATQVTYDGKPLYRFTLDQQAGAVSGNGVTDNFGNTVFTWHAVFTQGGGTDMGSPPAYRY